MYVIENESKEMTKFNSRDPFNTSFHSKYGMTTTDYHNIVK
jgi:hypothetical protein